MLGHQQLREAQARGLAEELTPAVLRERPTLASLLPQLARQSADTSYSAGLGLLIAGIRATSDVAGD